MELALGAALTAMAYLTALLTVWVRERHRQARVAKVTGQLPHGSRYIDDAGGVVIEFGPQDDGARGECRGAPSRPSHPSRSSRSSRPRPGGDESA